MYSKIFVFKKLLIFLIIIVGGYISAHMYYKKYIIKLWKSLKYGFFFSNSLMLLMDINANMSHCKFFFKEFISVILKFKKNNCNNQICL